MSKKEEYVCKGFIIPKRGKDDEPIYIKEFTINDREKLYEKYKNFLKEFICTYLTINGKKSIDNVNDIRDLLDALIFYLRSLFIIDPIPKDIIEKILKGEATNYIPSPTVLLKGLIINEFKENLNESIKSIKDLESIKNLENSIKKLITHIKVLSKLDDLAKGLSDDPSILDFPADTRPGSNTSSLILHMLTVSAVAISIYMYRNGNVNDADIQVLRLISLFHDVGKIKDWYYHKSESANFLDEIFEKCIKNNTEVREIINRARNAIKEEKEEQKDELYKIFKEADRIASSLDRIPSVILTLLSEDKQQIIKNKLKGREFDEVFSKWEFWEQFTEEEIRELTEDFCKNASNIERISELLESEDDILTNEIVIARLDFKSIQSFIRSNYLKVMNGASRLVDLTIFTILPFILCYRLGLYPENILYNGGGNITIVIPANKGEDIRRFIDSNNAIYPIRYIRYIDSYLYHLFINTNREINTKLSYEKLIRDTEGEKKIDHNLYELCKSCGNNAILKTSQYYDEEEKDMCDHCRAKYRVGKNYHFGYKIDMLQLVNNNDKNELLMNILEYIAGHSIEEIKTGIKKYKEIALIKFDGNLMGQLMASSISLTDAFERSIRIDQSIKYAFISFLNKLHDNKLEEYAKRIIMGLQYIGGDDGLMIVPSIISIPFVLYIINEYYLNMGKRSTLSVGIVIAKPKHPIQSLKEGVEYLLDEIAKKDARQYAYDVYKYNNKDEFKGALAFYVADGGKISNESLRFVFDRLVSEALTIQPYLVINNINKESINRLLNIIKVSNNNVRNNTNSNDIREYVDMMLLSYLTNEIKLKDDIQNNMKNIRNICLKSIQISIGNHRDLNLKIIYSIKEAGNNHLIHNIVNNLLFVKANRYRFALYDLYMLLNMLGVEYD